MAKQPSLTQSMSELHTWAGLVLGWVLFAIFLTGTLAVFDKELNWWMQPELRVTGQSQAEAVQVAEDWLRANHAGASEDVNGKPSNTCYMVATLQAIANVRTIREFVQYVGQHARGDDAVTHTHIKCPRAVH